MSLGIEERLQGTRRGAILREWLTNSVHFPVANAILELLSHGSLDYFMEPDAYALLVGSFVQAAVLGTLTYRKKHYAFLGNLVGPFLYSCVEFVFEGSSFLAKPHHLAYWIISILIGITQQIRYSGAPALIRQAGAIFENITRTSIVLLMYGIYEWALNPEKHPVFGFFEDVSHVYVAVVILLLGLVLGFGAVTQDKYLGMLQSTAHQMRRFSEWYLGGDLLDAVVRDENALLLQRRERTVVFMDIRGFTSWSEDKAPEKVVGMLNTYFAQAEKMWTPGNIIKIKYTGDEIMAVAKDAAIAVQDAIRIAESVKEDLSLYNLTVGTGVHSGPLVEGLIGGEGVKLFDVIGDTVNTAKRICDNAVGGTVMITESVRKKLGDGFAIGEAKQIAAKGKKEPLTVWEVRLADTV